MGTIFESDSKEVLIPSSTLVTLADGSRERMKGEVNTQFTLRGTRKHLPVRLVQSLNYDCILGMDFSHSFGLVIDFRDNSWKFVGQKNSQ